MKTLFLLLIANSCFAQGFGGVDLPFFAKSTTTNSPCSYDITSLSGILLYVDVNQRVLNLSGSAAGDNEAVSSWGDLSVNLTNNLYTQGRAGYVSGFFWPTNHLTGGPNNGRWIKLDYDCNCQGIAFTNTMGASAVPQPNTFFFVMKDNWQTGGGAVLNGYYFQEDQWNYSVGGENLYAGANALFTAAPPVGIWPNNTWAIITVQFNGASSKVRVNGTNYATGLNVGTFGMTGITVGNYKNWSNPARIGIAALVWVNGSNYTDEAKLLQIEERLGCEFGIPVP